MKLAFLILILTTVLADVQTACERCKDETDETKCKLNYVGMKYVEENTDMKEYYDCLKAIFDEDNKATTEDKSDSNKRRERAREFIIATHILYTDCDYKTENNSFQPMSVSALISILNNGLIGTADQIVVCVSKTIPTMEEVALDTNEEAVIYNPDDMADRVFFKQTFSYPFYMLLQKADGQDSVQIDLQDIKTQDDPYFCTTEAKQKQVGCTSESIDFNGVNCTCTYTDSPIQHIYVLTAYKDIADNGTEGVIVTVVFAILAFLILIAVVVFGINKISSLRRFNGDIELTQEEELSVLNTTK